MMTSQRAVANAIVDLLLAASTVAADRVYLNRKRSLGTSVMSAIVVRLERSASQLSSVQGGPTDWSTLIAVECYGRASGASADSPADELVEQAFAALGADPDLGDTVMDVEPLAGDTLAWDFDELDSGMDCITARFVVKHRTTGRTLTL